MGGERTVPEAPSPLFDAWLADATRGLCDFAKGQVREEYEDHFAAEYEDMRAEGLGEEEAERAAVGSLGDARHVRRQLRVVYFTRVEHRYLERMLYWGSFHGRSCAASLRLPWGTGLLAGMLIAAPLLLAIGLFGVFAWHGNRGALAALYFLFALSFLPVCLALLALLADRFARAGRHWSLEDRLRRGGLFGSACGVALFGAGVGISVLMSSPDWIFFPFALWMLGTGIIEYRVARKLRRYPARNAAPVVMKLRKVYGETERENPG